MRIAHRDRDDVQAVGQPIEEAGPLDALGRLAGCELHVGYAVTAGVGRGGTGHRTRQHVERLDVLGRGRCVDPAVTHGLLIRPALVDMGADRWHERVGAEGQADGRGRWCGRAGIGSQRADDCGRECQRTGTQYGCESVWSEHFGSLHRVVPSLSASRLGYLFTNCRVKVKNRYIMPRYHNFCNYNDGFLASCII